MTNLSYQPRTERILIRLQPEELARAAVLAKGCRAQVALADGRLYGRDGTKLVCWNVKK